MMTITPGTPKIDHKTVADLNATRPTRKEEPPAIPAINVEQIRLIEIVVEVGLIDIVIITRSGIRTGIQSGIHGMNRPEMIAHIGEVVEAVAGRTGIVTVGNIRARNRELRWRGLQVRRLAVARGVDHKVHIRKRKPGDHLIRKIKEGANINIQIQIMLTSTKCVHCSRMT